MDLTCSQCGVAYRRKPSAVKNSKTTFCSQACYGLWLRTHRVWVGRKRVTVLCHICGTVLQRIPSSVGAHCFCSPHCLHLWRSINQKGATNPAWLGGHSQYRGPNWKQQRGLALTRDGHTCLRCGSTATPCVHHVRPFRLFLDYRKANDLGNLRTLCPPCHGHEEMKFWKAFTGKIPKPCTPHRMRACKKCGQDFLPASSAHRVCNSCKQSTCAHCGKVFLSPKAPTRKVKYCSKSCRNATIANPKRRICVDCGGTCHSDAKRCKSCDTAYYRNNPQSPRRGRKPSHNSPRLISSSTT